MRWFAKCSNDSAQFVKFVNMSDSQGYTSLSSAVQHNHLGIVKRLLRIKEVDVNKGKITPLHIALPMGNFEITRVKSFSPRLHSIN